MDQRSREGGTGNWVVRRAFLIAAETGEACPPVHLLATLAEVEGPIAEAVCLTAGGPLFPRVSDPLPVREGGAHYLSMQTRQAADEFATARGEAEAPEHLLLAVIDPRQHSAQTGFPFATLIRGHSRRGRTLRFRWLRREACLVAGWATWCRNRQVGPRNRWFQLRTLASYRGAPQR